MRVASTGAGTSLGPVLIRVPCAGRVARLRAGAVCLAGVALLIGAAALTPDPTGLGTHRQLGLPACTAPMLWGIPCPTCGMTTAFAHTVRGQWRAALHAQPAGWLAAVATALLAVVSAATVVTGRKWVVNWYRVPPGCVATTIVVIILSAWAYRIGVTLGLL